MKDLYRASKKLLPLEVGQPSLALAVGGVLTSEQILESLLRNHPHQVAAVSYLCRTSLNKKVSDTSDARQVLTR